MVHDHYYWRDHEAFTRTQLVGVRAVLNALDAFRNEYGLIADLPGFQFVDWAMGGEPPGAMEGLSCTINLHYLLTLDCAIDLEEHLGEPHLAALYRSRRETVISALRRVFWSAQRGCFADDADHAHFSEHCLSLSVRSGILDEQERTSTAAQLQSADDLIVCELYYSHYLFDAYHRLGLGDAILERLADWRRSLAMGLKTTPERYPEDARSDCHAWSAHPLFHFFTSIAGIRPAAPGFASVLVSPTPGSLPHLTAKMPHPQGYIAVDLHFSGNHCKGSIDLTAPISGRFCWQGCEQELKQGLNNVDITSTDR
ncbi:MAG: alpha-L-rhamnosidase C-terminal domain-containing protein [Candidatus Sumerlaeota bacterium]